MDKYELEEKIAKTEYLVEADDFTKQALWQRHSHEGLPFSRSERWDGPRFEWRDLPGVGFHIGDLDGRPLMLTVMWSIVGGALVGFYHGSSQLVDHARIEEYLDEKFPDVPRTDARNLRVLAYLEDRDGAPVRLDEAGQALGRETVELYRKGGILTTRAVEMALVARDRGEDGAEEVLVAVQGLGAQCEKFREHVWLPWLKKYYEGAPSRGHEGKAGPLNVMVYGLAGRVMVTMRFSSPEPGQEDWFLSLLGYEGDTDGMYVRGVLGNAAVMSNMLDVAIQHADALREDIHPDDAVRLAV